MLDLHYWPTPNGKKVTIQLEECGLDYSVIECNIGKGDQFTEEFLAINPNTRMPVLVDHDPVDGQGFLSVFESGAIMLYIAAKPDSSCQAIREPSTKSYSGSCGRWPIKGQRVANAGTFVA